MGPHDCCQPEFAAGPDQRTVACRLELECAHTDTSSHRPIRDRRYQGGGSVFRLGCGKRHRGYYYVPQQPTKDHNIQSSDNLLGSCPVLPDYESVMVHEIGHALGLVHYPAFDTNCPPTFGDDGPEGCTVMTQCYEHLCETVPGELDERAIRCLYRLVLGGTVSWSYLKGLYGPSCIRPQFSNLMALSSETNNLVWNAGAVGTGDVMIFRGVVGEDLELVAVNEPDDTMYVDQIAESDGEYSYLVATANGDTLLDLGSARAGLQRVNVDETITSSLSALQTSGHNLYAFYGDLVRKFSLEDPTTPIEVDSENPNDLSSISGLSISDDGETLFATSLDKLAIIRSSSLTTLAYFDFAQSSTPFYDVVGHGNFAMVASDVGLYAVGLIPTTQQWGVCGSYANGDAILSVDRVGDYLYMKRSAAGVVRSEIVRVTHNPNGTCSLALECASNMPCWTAGIGFVGAHPDGSPGSGYALATQSDGTLVVLDVTDPVHPLVRKGIDVYTSPNPPFPITAYAFDDRYLYLLTNMSGFWLERGLHAYDLLTPGNEPVYATGGSGGTSLPYGLASRGRYLYVSDKFTTDPWETGSGHYRLGVFKKAYVSASLATGVRAASGGALVDRNAIMCPQGDADQIVVSVAVDASFVTTPPSLSTLSVRSPTAGGFAFGSAVTYADSTPVLASGDYRATVTLRSGRGCGDDSVGVYWGGSLLGYQSVRVKSPDVNTSGSSSGIVDLVDFATFAAHSYSSVCDCIFPKSYSGCSDFAYPDTIVNLPDFGFYGAHHDHHVGGGSMLSSTSSLPSDGSVGLSFVEDIPAVGPRKLRVNVVLSSFEPFLVMFLKLGNGSGSYRLDEWHPSSAAEYASFGTATTDDSKDLIVGVVAKKSASSASIDLGYFEFVASSNEPATYDPSDFTLEVADLLDRQNVPRTVSSRNVDRRTAPVQYRNELAQNYPNPFNPSTTIAFSLALTASVELTIYDVKGSRIRELVRGRKEAGVYRVAWDGADQRGTRVASGVYFYRLTTPSFQATKKMVLLR